MLQSEKFLPGISSAKLLRRKIIVAVIVIVSRCCPIFARIDTIINNTSVLCQAECWKAEGSCWGGVDCKLQEVVLFGIKNWCRALAHFSSFYILCRNSFWYCQVTSSAIGFRVRTSQGEAAIVEENVLASDGVIHVIDAVLWSTLISELLDMEENVHNIDVV